MQMNIHQTHHTLGDFKAIETYLYELAQKSPSGLHLFPELFLTGYPLMDLCLQRPFIDAYLDQLERLNQWCQHQWKPGPQSVAFLVGGLEYEFDQRGLPHQIKNVVYEMRPGAPLKSLYAKKLLPNYDIFDEEKYYTPGQEVGLYSFEGETFGLLICEDMWVSSFHGADPVAELLDKTLEEKITLRAVINLSASPFFLGKQIKREERAQEIARHFGAPFIYVNKVGAEDEILFDGQSFITDGQQVIARARAYGPEVLSVDCPPLFKAEPRSPMSKENTWEGLFQSQWRQDQNRTILHPLNDQDCRELIDSLSFGLQEYARKTGFQRFSVALSGGIDSALVLALAKLALLPGQELEAIFMPGFFSSPESWDLSEKLCQRLQIRLRHFPIKFTHSSLRNSFRESFGDELTGLADENIQSRIRGLMLYARSNQWNSLVINTSNKSEIAVGYSTLYGDSVGALSLLGDLYKTEVFQLARYLHRLHDQLIPMEIIEREPSAELREGQADSQSLPDYAHLDIILDGFLSYRFSVQDMVKMGYPEETVRKVYGLYQKSEYKRKQFCPILKVKPKSFGFGYRVPICKTILT